MPAVNGTGGRKSVWIIQASYRYVDAAGLLVPDPRKCGAACAAKCPGNASG